MGLFTEPRPAPPLFPAPFATAAVLAAMRADIDNHVRDTMLDLRRPPHRGDKVSVTLDGYIDHIDPNGDLYISKARRPFHDPDEHMLVVPSRNTTVVERAPAEPCVGDEITGRQVRETPWRRGTVLYEHDTAYVLTADGQWLNTLTGTTFGFEEWDDTDRARVVYAPGKKTP